MITIKNEKDLNIMKKCGAMTATVMEKVLQNSKPGVTKAELDKIADNEIKRFGGVASFKTVSGYRWATCITVNEEVVHGVPNGYVLKENDLVSVDLGVKLLGFHTDMARTIYLGPLNFNIAKFIKTGQKALKLAIKEARVGKVVGNISAVIQKTVESEKYSVVRALVGHGIGRELHEDPQIPGFVTSEPGPELKVGMTLAIEVIYTQGLPDVVMKGTDGWTIATKDGSLGGLFEDTVAITKKGSLVLTKKD